MIVNIKQGFIFLGSRYRVINNKTIVSISSNKKITKNNYSLNKSAQNGKNVQ